MARIAIAITLVLLFAGYSVLIYTKGTQEDIFLPKEEQVVVTKGKALFQKHNSQLFYQMYGMGIYLNMDLTMVYANKCRGETYVRALLQNVGNLMPECTRTGKQTQTLDKALSNYLTLAIRDSELVKRKFSS